MTFLEGIIVSKKQTELQFCFQSLIEGIYIAIIKINKTSSGLQLKPM
jgi:hypothetical protein